MWWWVSVVVVAALVACAGVEAGGPAKPLIRKLGTLDCDMVETTPIVFGGKLYRFEYVRQNHWANQTGKSYFRFIDVAAGTPTPAFAQGFHLGSAFVDGGTVYVYGVTIWDASDVHVFWSKDMTAWQSQVALKTPGWGLFNTSVCKGDGRYVMAFEVGRPPEVVGSRFTMRFAESKDAKNWTILPEPAVYTKERYSACPALEFLDGLYYMIYLKAGPGYQFVPHIVRSKDLATWESSPLNPLMTFGDEDRRIANPKLPKALLERVAKAKNHNNSDVDLCEFEGKTVIYYSWGNQQGVEHLAEAVYEGSLPSFLRGFFPKQGR
ncbi:hypothetical protein HQ576_17045 [bacterium]|nr:hypothetical protein [bacterium]